MTGRARAGLLADGRRLHLQHGPIDIVAEAFGEPVEVRTAYRQAAARFETVLDSLVAELALLRKPEACAPAPLRGRVARRMAQAVHPHRTRFVTPMAAVAGAVADEVLAAAVAGRRLSRAYVNNGGDIAFHFAPGESLSVGVVRDESAPGLDAVLELRADRPSRGLATSGWRGRSLSRGIADAVTVLARTAATADAAATLIANAVDWDHPAIERRPASALREESDLGDRLVTVAVPPLPKEAVAGALEAGLAEARAMKRRGLVEAVFLALQGRTRAVAPEDRPGQPPAADDAPAEAAFARRSKAASLSRRAGSSASGTMLGPSEGARSGSG